MVTPNSQKYVSFLPHNVQIHLFFCVPHKRVFYLVFLFGIAVYELKLFLYLLNFELIFD